MRGKIIYAGDTSLSTSASYMAGILDHAQLAFDYVASSDLIGPRLCASIPSLVILSDYPASNFREDDFKRLLENVQCGTGCLMLGGWESFRGLSGDYQNTPLSDVLPVTMLEEDDRINASQPWVIEPVGPHPITDQLPFCENPTYVGGFNHITPRDGTETVLQLRSMAISMTTENVYRLQPGESKPLLVTGSFGEGRVAALATDVAPHWVGGFVDWGSRRLEIGAKGARELEVGEDYVEFFTRLVRWASGHSQL